MRQRYAVSTALGLLLGLTLAVSANATVLWDQSVISPAGPGIAASNSPGFGGFVAHSVDDVTVPASGWVVLKITQYYGGFNYGWEGGVVKGFLNIIPKTGSLPTGVPATSQVPMSCGEDIAKSTALGQTVFTIVANVNVSLPPGDYWIGLTPSGSAGIDGANQMWPSAMTGEPVVTYFSPSGPWAASYGNWDGAFLIEGDIPTPTHNSTWGAIKSLYH